MIGYTIQCGASNGLNGDELQQLSLPVSIDPYCTTIPICCT